MRASAVPLAANLVPGLVRGLISGLALCFAPAPAFAAPPEVIADIPPVHSLVAQVMQGMAEPGLLLPPGGSPHGHQMRPSEARALASAGLLFWIGPEQSPWLDHAIDTIGTDLTSIPLMEITGTVLRPGGHDHDAGHDPDHTDEHHNTGHGEDAQDDTQNGATGTESDHTAHEADHGAHDDHGPDNHADHDQTAHDNHDAAHFTGDGHDHSGIDPHVWLDPDNALIWLPEIARHLAEADPDNAATYRANAAAAIARITDLKAKIATLLAPVTGGYVVYHDAYGYFTDRFGIPPAGIITNADATTPGAKQLAALRSGAADQPVRCLFTEPQFDSRAARQLADTLGAKTGMLDPVGSSLNPGPGLYTSMLENIAQGLADCLLD